MVPKSPSLWISLLLLLLFSSVFLHAADISCRNEAGEPVDWFVLYKLPKYKNNKEAVTGLDYMYLDSQSLEWQMSNFLINMTDSALGVTLEQLYQTYAKQENSTAYVLYNDASPNSRNYSTKPGHTKGCLLFDKSQGFWLIHSIPGFPPFPENGYSYPSSGKKNGQTVICVTYKYEQYSVIARQLLLYNPKVYNCSIPQIFQQELIHLQKICLGSHQPWVPRKSIEKLQSAQGELFVNFAKSHFYIDDIYVSWMAQSLETHLLTESWQHGRKELPSNCSLQYHVYNIKKIKLPDSSFFYSSYDHSKWCVSLKYEDQWTCLGDLNRTERQIWRSGGFICTQNPHIYKAFRNLVSYYQNCPDADELSNK